MSQVTVRQLMKTPAKVVHPGATLLQARDEMTKLGVHHLPVVDGGGGLIGMISDREVDRILAVMQAAEGKRLTLTVGDVCRGEALRVTPELPAHQAASMLIESRTDGLPVVDKGQVIGVITATDLLEVAREALLGVDPGKRARA